MERRLAKLSVLKALEATKPLTALVQIVGEHASEQKDLKLKIATLIYQIGEALLDPMFEEYPDLRVEIEENIQKFGIAF